VVTAGTYGALSVVPAVLAIVFALSTKRALPALLLGILAAHAILAGPDFLLFPFRAVDQLIGIAANPSNFGLIFFSVAVGALLKLIGKGRGFEAVALGIGRRRSRHGRGTAFTLNFVLGAALFMETWSNVLVSGTTLGPIYDRLRISRERLAYFTHTIGITVVSMILVNTWGAFYIGLLTAQGIAEPFDFAVRSIPFMLYGWCSIALIALVMVTGLSIGPMRAAERAAGLVEAPEASRDERACGAKPRLTFFFIPIGVLLGTLLASLHFTGGGDFSRGDGTASGVYAVVAAIAAAAALARLQARIGLAEIETAIVSGMRDFFEVAILIVFALAIGSACRDLGTGQFIAQLAGETMPAAILPALVFVTGAIMSFATGTSYGTFSIMVPIALPMASAVHLDPTLLFGACIAGGVFGDNCSPISDTSIVTGMGAGVAAIDHVRTQLPYALIAAGAATVGYLVLGFAS
jgi:tetracycline resistance efflux pump